MWIQKEIRIKPRVRGFHLITDEVIRQIPELLTVAVGVMHIFIKHTSASLTVNENADPTVRIDFETVFNVLVPEGRSDYRHNDEGDDDLPAHIKASLMGSSVSLPIVSGQFNIGIWQGLYLCEHRNHGGSRALVVTVNGQAK